MTRKDYQQIARVLSARCQVGDDLGMPEIRRETEQVAISLSISFLCTHPRFDRDKFLTACSVTVEEIR
jgi:hypothetical protein